MTSRSGSSGQAVGCRRVRREPVHGAGAGPARDIHRLISIMGTFGQWHGVPDAVVYGAKMVIDELVANVSSTPICRTPPC